MVVVPSTGFVRKLTRCASRCGLLESDPSLGCSKAASSPAQMPLGDHGRVLKSCGSRFARQSPALPASYRSHANAHLHTKDSEPTPASHPIPPPLEPTPTAPITQSLNHSISQSLNHSIAQSRERVPSARTRDRNGNPSLPFPLSSNPPPRLQSLNHSISQSLNHSITQSPDRVPSARTRDRNANPSLPSHPCTISDDDQNQA